jgi:catechol 2,3-dioxygenase-like lactoylglutathione lyase family enzyme
MDQQLAQIAILVEDYDEAIDFYVRKLKFNLIEDTRLSDSKRWVVVRPEGGGSCSLLLAKAADPKQISCIGNQTGGRVFLFLHTDDLDRDHQNLLNHAIEIIRGPATESFGKVLVFKDLYGNKWDLIQRFQQ